MECSECPYYWADTDDTGRPISYNYCHYKHDDGYAPCEADETETYYEEEQ